MPDVIQLPLGFVSAFLVRGERVILIDAGTPSTTERLRKAIDASGIKASDISLILLTHGHTDHAGGAASVRMLTGAKIATHEACARTLRDGKQPTAPPRTLPARLIDTLFGRFMKIAPIEPDIVFHDRMDLRPYGIEGEAIATPGHTDGCISILLADGQAIVGDLIAGAAKGQRAKLPLFLWDLDRLRCSLGQILDAAPRVIHNAHGDPCTLDACRQLYDSIRPSQKC
jgi:hydroxyacylglutathione hydrolase